MTSPLRSHPDATTEWRAAYDRASAQAPPDTRTAYALAFRRGFVLTVREASAAGIPLPALRSLIRADRWSRPRRGTTCVLGRTTLADLGQHASDLIEAVAVARVRRGTAVSHASACVAHGLPLLATSTRPSVTTFGASVRGTCTDAGSVRGARLEDREIVGWFGVPVTSPARTVIDMFRSAGRRAGLVAADAAVHQGLTDLDGLTGALGGRSHWPGIRAARELLQLVEPGSESPLETLVRLLAHDAGLPRPRSQWWIDLGDVRYRVDLAWPEHGLIVEADGAVKYTDPNALWMEKRRQERLERAGWIVVRVTWNDVIRYPVQTIERLLAAYRRPARLSSGLE